jgi:hypothetical protein
VVEARQPHWNLETVINLIGATRTRSGLRVKALLDTARYETGVKVSDEQIDKQRIRRLVVRLLTEGLLVRI